MRETAIRVLVAPLDWGLGHATRCIPVIEALLRRGCKVLIAGSGFGGEILRKRFPNLVFESLPSYNITYPRKGSMALHLLKQLPPLLSVIRTERQALEQIIARHQVSHVISDNRYGLHSNAAKCIFMTHQIHVSSGSSHLWIDQLLFVLHRRFIEKFDGAWIVDEPVEHKGKWAGKLSSPEGLRIPYRFVGLLSRFSHDEPKLLSKEDPFQRIALLSGPEPQRSLLEEKILRHFDGLPGKSLIVRGIAGDDVIVDKKTTILNGIDDLTLSKAISSKPIVYCRSGYSTLMDLLHLQHTRAVLIPTPGQTEQVYLGARFERMFGFTCIGQHMSMPVENEILAAQYPKLNDRNLLEESIDQLLSASSPKAI